MTVLPLPGDESTPPQPQFEPYQSLEDNPTGPCGSVGTSGQICDCLECALRATNAAIADIAAAIREKKEDACNYTDACIDKIWTAIKKKVEGPRYSCDQCKAMVAAGAGGTIEYAVRCANIACNDCVQSCMGEGGPINEGKCCTTCGSANCKCENGVCKPQENEPEGKFRGWCNTVTKAVVVLKKSDPSPGPDWQPGPLSQTEAVALAQIQSLCKGENQPIPIPNPLPNPGPVQAGAVGCDINEYITGNAATILNVAGVSANIASGSAQAWDTVSRIGLEGFNLGTIGGALFGLTRSMTGADPIIANSITPNLAKAFGCNNTYFTETFKAVAAISQGCNYLGVDPTPWLTQHYYQMNAICRMKHLSPDGAMAAFLADADHKVDLNAHFAIAGVCTDAMQYQLQASKSKMIPLQLAVARRRELISPERYTRGMRELGYIDESVPETLFKLTEQVPPMSEIIRYMVRDADDESLVERFGLDDYFNSKYGKQLKKWSQDQGISEQQAKYSWRSHWNIPAPGQLMTFWHRLRYNPKFGGKDKMREDIKAAMIQQDILPRWHDYFLEVSFRPMRLVDIRRSFQIGSLSDAELVPAYLDLGYSDETAEKMAKFTTRLRDRAVVNELPVKQWLRGSLSRESAIALLAADGIPQGVIERALSLAEPNFDKSTYARAFVRGDITREQLLAELNRQGVSNSAATKIADKLAYSVRTHPVIDEFEAGLVHRDDAIHEMVVSGMNGDIAETVVTRIEKHLKLQWVKQCISGIKRRFLTGELDQQEAQTELTQRNVTGARAAELVRWWGCELSSGEKQVSAAQLCEWLSRGAITTVQFLDRLKRIGYTESDAAMMLEDCLIRANAKSVAKELKEAKERMADQVRTQRILASAAKQEYAALQRLEANRKKSAKTRQNREKSLATAVGTVYGKCECDMYTAQQTVRDVSNSLQQQYGLSIDRSLQLVNLAANKYTGESLEEFAALAHELAESVISAGFDGTEEQLPPAPSTNGVT